MKKRKIIETDEIEKIICDWCFKDISEVKSKYEKDNFVFKWELLQSKDESTVIVTKYESDFCFACKQRLIETMKKMGIKIEPEIKKEFKSKKQYTKNSKSLHLDPPYFKDD